MASETSVEKLQDLLRQIFQFDLADLDFGIYRILNLRRDKIENFLKKDLPQAVSDELSKGALAEQSKAAKELKEAEAEVRKTLGDDAIDAEGNLADAYKKVPIGKKYMRLREKAKGTSTRDVLEAMIFNHLYTFFNRYYDNGDFMSKRRYSKREKYAIPYNGEEVHLHWTNNDQYYVKTGEQFADYAFKSGEIKVLFKIRNADVEQNNVKGDSRYFIPFLNESDFDVGRKVLVIPFEYRPFTEKEKKAYGKKNQQDMIIAKATELAAKHFKEDNAILSALMNERRKTSDGEIVSYLEHHLRRYTRKNTSDYFIHKDLKGFLEREMDFYIKNEVLNVDEIESGGESRAEEWFQLMRVIKAIGKTIIAFLAQIENFQKKLFEKKKFVTQTNYCAAVGNISEEFYDEITENEGQWAEWKDIFRIDEEERGLFTAKTMKKLRMAFLKAHPTLVLDTKHFEPDFIDRLLASYDNLEEMIDGLLIDSENFQALNLLLAKYREKVKCIYIDPPYNTDASAIIYKNDYKDSSWLSLMENRLWLAYSTLKRNGIICVAIDDEEVSKLRLVLSRFFEKEIGIVAVRSNPAGRKTKGRLAPAHEYALFFGKSKDSIPESLPRTEKAHARFPLEDKKGRFAWSNFIRSGSGDKREDRPKLYYPILVRSDDTIRIPLMEWDPEAQEYTLLEKIAKDETPVYPKGIKNGRVIEKRWQRGHKRVSSELDEFRVRRSSEGEISIDFKTRMDPRSLPTTWWDAKEYASANYGAAETKDLHGDKIFDFAKSRRLVIDCLKTSGVGNVSETVLVSSCINQSNFY